MKRSDIVSAFIIVVAIWALIASIKFASDEGEAWERFRTEHRCTEVDLQHPPAGIETTPGKTTWQCDDGVYVRNGN